jgi:hypothetical protein
MLVREIRIAHYLADILGRAWFHGTRGCLGARRNSV